MGSAEKYLALLNEFADECISAEEYRTRILNLRVVEGEHIPDDCPVFPVTSELWHDALEFVPTKEYRESEDMSEEDLRIRASFGQDVIRLSLWYYGPHEGTKLPPSTTDVS